MKTRERVAQELATEFGFTINESMMLTWISSGESRLASHSEDVLWKSLIDARVQLAAREEELSEVIGTCDLIAKPHHVTDLCSHWKPLGTAPQESER